MGRRILNRDQAVRALKKGWEPRLQKNGRGLWVWRLYNVDAEHYATVNENTLKQAEEERRENV